MCSRIVACPGLIKNNSARLSPLDRPKLKVNSQFSAQAGFFMQVLPVKRKGRELEGGQARRWPRV